MTTVLLVILFLVFVKLVLVAGMQPVPSSLSSFELERLVQSGDPSAIQGQRRQRLLPDVLSLLRILTALLLVIFVVISVATLQWLFGTLLAVFVALEYGAIARIGFISKRANRLYQVYESRVLDFVEKSAPVFRFVRSSLPSHPAAALNSKQELEHLVEGSGTVLSPEERKLIVNGLGFTNRTVGEIMTPRSVIDSIDKKEHLGPLVLNDLHKTGHSRFPVVAGDIDHVVGMLHVQDLLTIDAKRKSTSVEKAMEPRAFYIKQDQTLEHALAAFLKTRHHLFVVVNEFRETVGLLSLEDVIEALLGRQIVDEFDTHEDLRVVAARNPRQNNHSKASTDV